MVINQNFDVEPSSATKRTTIYDRPEIRDGMIIGTVDQQATQELKKTAARKEKNQALEKAPEPSEIFNRQKQERKTLKFAATLPMAKILQEVSLPK
ncbi:hypothetical protein AVEN_257997-1 [Araneus ventricosus]|uniref:Uncharacterized protein n=1 Tax=Araneus ventricosus TaxID=182803 RepID=A0A4Y2G495_ARAVE|nr:hypothetical protein AVEN_257997-1 [Araneus ventricosus]